MARRRVTLRLDGHQAHVISDGVPLARTLPSLIPADRGTLLGARIAAARQAVAMAWPWSDAPPPSPQQGRFRGSDVDRQ